jgi:Cys-tRNA(Pro) deacylase
MKNKIETPLTRFLNQQQVDFRLLLHQMIKCILLRDMDDQYALACVPGDQSVDPKKVRHHLGWKRMTCVSRDKVELITGYQIGAVTPLLIQHHMPILFDPSTRNEPIITISSGDRRAGIAMQTDDLILLCQPNFVEILKN